MHEKIMVTRPFYPERKVFDKYVDQIWENRWLTNQGPMHEEFHQKLKAYLGVENITLTVNGHIALEVAEQAWISHNMINNLSDSDFISVFGEELKKPSCSGAEIECEKFFALVRLEEINPAALDQAFAYYLNHALDDAFIQAMIKAYSFGDSDFFSLFQQTGRKNSTCTWKERLKSCVLRFIHKEGE